MKTKSIVLEESLVDAIHARQIKLSGLERLMAFAMSTSQYTIPDDKINALKEEYFDVNAEYEMLKQKITDMLPEDFDPARSNWNLDFENNTVIFNEN